MDWLRNLGRLLFGLVLALLLAEGGLRLFFALAPTPPNSLYLPDRDCVYRLRPDPPAAAARDPDYATNSFGFRDHEHTVDKPPGTFRLLGIGDSFVYSTVRRLDDHFLRLAGNAVQDTLRPDSLRVETILMGLGGYSPVNEVGVLRSIGLRLHPDLLVLNFFVGNDVTGLTLRGKVLGGRLYFSGSPYPWLRLLRSSYLFMVSERVLLPQVRGPMLHWFLRRHAAPPAVAERRPGADSGHGEDSKPAPEQLSTYSDWYLHSELKDLPVYLKNPDPETARLWTEAEQCLQEFDHLCRSAGVPWALVLIPADVQVSDPLRQLLFQRLHLPSRLYDFQAPQARLLSWAAEHGVPALDLLPVMQAKEWSAAPLYGVDDIHWNLRGNQVAGSAVGTFLAGVAARNCPPEPGR